MEHTYIDVKTMEQALLYSMDEMVRSFQSLLREVQNLVPPIPKLHIPKQPRVLVDNIVISMGYALPPEDAYTLPAIHVTFFTIHSNRTLPPGYVLSRNEIENTKDDSYTMFLRGFSIYPSNVTRYPQDIHEILVKSCKLHPTRVNRVITYLDYYSRWAQEMTSHIPDIHHKVVQQEAKAIERLILLASLRHIK